MHTTELITPLTRKMAVIALVISLITAVEQMPSFAASSPKAGKAVATITSKDGAVIRRSYSILSKKISVLAHKESFVVTSVRYSKKKSAARKNIWYYSPDLKGYIRSDLVKIAYKTKSSGKAKKKIAMRKGAGTKFDKVKTIKKSSRLTILLSATDSKGKKWLKVKSGKKTGFVRSSDVGSIKVKKTAAPANGRSSISVASTPEAVQTTVTGFPAGYSTLLNKLKRAHPNWEFRPVDTGLDWNQALDKMTANTGANTTYYTFGKAYRSTGKGDYNYLKDTYVNKDGTRFFAASRQAVAYYMDPRNFLDYHHIFMFEDQAYHADYQSLLTVQAIFKGRNSTLFKNAQYFITAGKKYDISPIFLATKALNEQGSGINSGKVKGKKVYNIFNVGAYDSASGGASNGVRFAGGSGSYQRPWTSVAKAIEGGAQYLSANFSTNRQNSGYLEHFNVLNGLSEVGTHVYMTAVYAPSSNAVTTYNNYYRYGILSNRFVFYIPVYRNMPSSACPKPSDGKVDNNFYLKTLTVSYGDTSKKLIRSSALNYDTSFTVKVSSGTKSVNIDAASASRTSESVRGTGKRTLYKGKNNFKVVCRSSSGQKRTYTITIIRS